MNTQISTTTNTLTNFLPLAPRSSSPRIGAFVLKAVAEVKKALRAFEKSWAASAHMNTRINELREETLRQAALVGMC